MGRLLLISMIYLMSISSVSFARSPAVMDFVMIEHESFQYQRVPSGADVTYNFEKKDYSKYQMSQMPQAGTNAFSLSTIFTLILLVCLPFAVFTAIKVRSENQQIDLQAASLKIMEKYKTAKKMAKDSEEIKKDDDISKAS